MKKRSRLLLAGVVLAAALSFGAMAAEGDAVKGGIYGISGTGATLTPQTEDKTAISAGQDGDTTGYYANAVRLGVTASNLESGKQYLLLVLKADAEGNFAVPTADNIVYIDQGAAENQSISFNAYPSTMSAGKYGVFLVGGGSSFGTSKPAATFSVDQKYTLGDVNNDGKIYSNDALFALQMAGGIGTWTPTQKLAADVNQDGHVYSNDALFILQKAAGLPTVF